MMDITQILMVILIVVNIVLFAYIISTGRRLSIDRRQIREEIKSLNGDINALCSGATGLGNHLSEIEHQVRRLYERQDQIELRDPGEREYQSAVKLIQNGADIEELLTTCSMTRGEAELLMMLHHSRKGENLVSLQGAGKQRAGIC